MVHSQVRRGRPGRRLQSLGNPRIDVYRALDTLIISVNYILTPRCREASATD